MSKLLSDLKIFRMEIKNANTKPIKSNKLRKVNTLRLESMKTTTQPMEIYDWKSEVFAFVVNAAMDGITNKF